MRGVCEGCVRGLQTRVLVYSDSLAINSREHLCRTRHCRCSSSPQAGLGRPGQGPQC